MSIWARISDALAALAAGEPLAQVFERLRTPPERSVAFTIAVIALGAKMAKADGLVTRGEVVAFREVFHIPAADAENAARVFNLARQDVAGFEEYARKIKVMFAGRSGPFAELMEGLFHIAVADGHYHDAEHEFLERVATIFELSPAEFQSLEARFVPGAPKDPYVVLGVPSDASLETIRKTWKQLVRDTHPDRMIARGVPPEAVKLAERRMQDINKAWETISRTAAPEPA
ncbi:TerB family tellurite resistance protein [Pseudaestuariivita sp.]|uniref:TerB family tellurite resistance protein n=1 Tax=Pseudaestuariivita sp. TaxID=2211669 RepID=UPI0040598F75